MGVGGEEEVSAGIQFISEVQISTVVLRPNDDRITLWFINIVSVDIYYIMFIQQNLIHLPRDSSCPYHWKLYK